MEVFSQVDGITIHVILIRLATNKGRKMLDKKTKKIIEDIYTLGGTELSLIIDAVKLRRNQLHTFDAQALRVGDRVTFTGRHSRIETGTVEKIKIKYVLIKTDRGQRWNVPGSHLTVITDKEAVDA